MIDVIGTQPGIRRRWAYFVVGVVGILFFAFVVIPALNLLGPVSAVRAAIDNRGIDAAALFYTESDVGAEATFSLRNALRSN
jgi:hypothetical protein